MKMKMARNGIKFHKSKQNYQQNFLIETSNSAYSANKQFY